MCGKLSELCCNALLFSNCGEKVMKSVLEFLFFGLSSINYRTTKHQSVVLQVFHAWWNICWVWKIVETTFQCIVVLQLRRDCPSTFMEPGSESAAVDLSWHSPPPGPVAEKAKPLAPGWFGKGRRKRGKVKWSHHSSTFLKGKFCGNIVLFSIAYLVVFQNRTSWSPKLSLN